MLEIIYRIAVSVIDYSRVQRSFEEVIHFYTVFDRISWPFVTEVLKGDPSIH